MPRVPFLDLREENELLEVAIRCFSISVSLWVARETGRGGK